MATRCRPFPRTLDEIAISARGAARFVLARAGAVDKMLDMREKARHQHISTTTHAAQRLSLSGLSSWTRWRARRGAPEAEPALRALIRRARRGPRVRAFEGYSGKPIGIVLSSANMLSGVRNAHRGGASISARVLWLSPMAWVATSPSRRPGVALRFTINIRSGRKPCCTPAEVARTSTAARELDNLLTPSGAYGGFVALK